MLGAVGGSVGNADAKMGIFTRCRNNAAIRRRVCVSVCKEREKNTTRMSFMDGNVLLDSRAFAFYSLVKLLKI